MNAKILNFGSINIDHVYQVPHFVQPGETLASLSLNTGLGGKGANQSVALARAGAAVAHIGRLNSADTWAVSLLNECGVDTQSIAQTEEPSGHAIIQVNNEGENSIVLHGGANQTFSRKELDAALALHKDAEYLLLQNECNLIEEAVELALTHDLKLVLNPAPMSQRILALPLHKFDTVIVNEVEAQALANTRNNEEIFSALATLMPNTKVVLTLGSEGCVLLMQGRVIKVAASKVEVVDTTAAGDTFVGYFLAGLCNSLSVQDSLQQACDAAAITVTRAGAISAIPTLSELNI